MFTQENLLKNGGNIIIGVVAILLFTYLYANAFLSGNALCASIFMITIAAIVGGMLAHLVTFLFRSGRLWNGFIASAFGGGAGAILIGGGSLYWLGQAAVSHVGYDEAFFEWAAIIGCISCAVVGVVVAAVIHLLPFNISAIKAAAIGSVIGAFLPYTFFSTLIYTVVSFSNL
jgi:hypothetical protein